MTTYSVRFPFSLTPGRALNDETVGRIGDHSARIDRSGNSYAMTVDGFSDELSAAAFVGELRAGLLFLSIQRDVPASAKYDLGEVAYYEAPLSGKSIKPGAVGLNDDDAPSVFPTGEVLIHLRMGGVGVTIGKPSQVVFEGLDSWYRSINRSAALNDPRLLIAADLYVAHFSESSSNARFLTLIMVLEALCEPLPRPEPVLALMASWKEQGEDVLKTWKEAKAAPSHIESLGALMQDFVRRETDSIKSQIRHLVRAAMAGDENLEAWVRRASKLYDARSELLHRGYMEDATGDEHAHAKTLAVKVLRWRAGFPSS